MTFIEFKDWLTALIVRNEGGLPDYDDWVEIKAKLDEVDRYEDLVLVDYTDAYAPEYGESTYNYEPDSSWNVSSVGFSGDGNFAVEWGSQFSQNTENLVLHGAAEMLPEQLELDLDFEMIIPTSDKMEEVDEAVAMELAADLQKIIDEMNDGKKKDS